MKKPIAFFVHHRGRGHAARTMAVAAEFARAFARADPAHGQPHVRIVGRGESAWSPAMCDELAAREPGGLVVADLGVQVGAMTHRLRRQVVIGANAGFRPGYVHFAARSASVPDLIGFLEERAPELGPDDQFAQGHRRATGGQVRTETWNRFAAGLGFGPEAQVS